MRIMCLDVGDVRIGVAVSDALGMAAHGLKTIDRAGCMPALKAVIEEYQEEIGSILVGLPKMMSGSVGIQGEKVLAFVEELKSSLQLPVIMWDERLSTVSAERTLIEAGLSREKRKGLKDKVAAVIILQSYLDSLSR
ncbi:MAG: Holliday junction resolvase RuvX [Nitrospirae bacterium]|nr:Holliday junction resolvase RuvX [Nitrospirota bacterium]